MFAALRLSRQGADVRGLIEVFESFLSYATLAVVHASIHLYLFRSDEPDG